MKFSYLLTDDSYHNTGDANSCPANYFEEFSVCERVNYVGALGKSSEGDTVVFGGGGLFMNDWHDSVIKASARGVKIIIWGAGMNYPEHKLPANVPASLAACKLVGIRDKRLAIANGVNWVPCASCLHPSFSIMRSAKPTHKLVQYCHSWGHLDMPGIPKRSNMDRSLSFQDVIEFLASGEAVVTDSYHGAYWSLLLGRDVIMWKPVTRMISGLPTLLPSATSYEQVTFIRDHGCFAFQPDWLRVCQDRNRAMFRAVMSTK
ncbi:MAG: polysaccharide pyruvyl transferase family protein [Planctomycetota bacterium]|jgi:hypothetical protein